MGNTTNKQPIPKSTEGSSEVVHATWLPTKSLFLSTADELAKTDDLRWILAMIEVDNFQSISDTESHEAADMISQTVGRAISSVMDQNQDIFKGFQASTNGNQFYLFIHCRNGKKSFAAETIATLISKIESTTTTTISAGLTRLKSEETSAEWTERAERNLKYRIKKMNGNGYTWNVKYKKAKKSRARTDSDCELEKVASTENEQKSETLTHDWCQKYNLTDIKHKIRKRNWTIEKLYRAKDINAVCKTLRLKQNVQQIRFKSAMECLQKSGLIIQKNEKRQLTENITHRYDYIEMNEKSSLTIPAKRGMISLECFVLIMKRGSSIVLNGKGQLRGPGEGEHVYIMDMPALGQPRGGGGGSGFGSFGADGTVGKGGTMYGCPKLVTKSGMGSDPLKLLLGSGGGSGYAGDAHGEGGGGIRIVCGEKLVLYENTKLLCNGTDGKGSSGGGSGGSIYLKAREIQIMNKNKLRIEALGGKGGKEGGGDAGDGRIRIDCNNDFDVLNKNIKPSVGYKAKF